MNTDKITLKNLQIATTIGVYTWETQVKQKISLDIEYALANPVSSEQAVLEDSYDYAQITQAVIEYVSQQSFPLVENLAAAVADYCLQEFSLPWVKIKLTKPQPQAQLQAVELCIERDNVI